MNPSLKELFIANIFRNMLLAFNIFAPISIVLDFGWKVYITLEIINDTIVNYFVTILFKRFLSRFKYTLTFSLILIFSGFLFMGWDSRLLIFSLGFLLVRMGDTIFYLSRHLVISKYSPKKEIMTHNFIFDSLASTVKIVFPIVAAYLISNIGFHNSFLFVSLVSIISLTFFLNHIGKFPKFKIKKVKSKMRDLFFFQGSNSIHRIIPVILYFNNISIMDIGYIFSIAPLISIGSNYILTKKLSQNKLWVLSYFQLVNAVLLLLFLFGGPFLKLISAVSYHISTHLYTSLYFSYIYMISKREGYSVIIDRQIYYGIGSSIGFSLGFFGMDFPIGWNIVGRFFQAYIISKRK